MLHRALDHPLLAHAQTSVQFHYAHGIFGFVVPEDLCHSTQPKAATRELSCDLGATYHTIDLSEWVYS